MPAPPAASRAGSGARTAAGAPGTPARAGRGGGRAEAAPLAPAESPAEGSCRTQAFGPEPPPMLRSAPGWPRRSGDSGDGRGSARRRGPEGAPGRARGGGSVPKRTAAAGRERTRGYLQSPEPPLPLFPSPEQGPAGVTGSPGGARCPQLPQDALSITDRSFLPRHLSARPWKMPGQSRRVFSFPPKPARRPTPRSQVGLVFR